MKHRIQTDGRKWLSKPEPCIGCSALYEEEEEEEEEEDDDDDEEEEEEEEEEEGNRPR